MARFARVSNEQKYRHTGSSLHPMATRALQFKQRYRQMEMRHKERLEWQECYKLKLICNQKPKISKELVSLRFVVSTGYAAIQRGRDDLWIIVLCFFICLYFGFDLIFLCPLWQMIDLVVQAVWGQVASFPDIGRARRNFSRLTNQD